MSRLRSAMTSRYKERNEDVKIHTPRNLETLQLSFRGERVAKASSGPYPPPPWSFKPFDRPLALWQTNLLRTAIFCVDYWSRRIIRIPYLIHGI